MSVTVTITVFEAKRTDDTHSRRRDLSDLKKSVDDEGGEHFISKGHLSGCTWNRDIYLIGKTGSVCNSLVLLQEKLGRLSLAQWAASTEH